MSNVAEKAKTLWNGREQVGSQPLWNEQEKLTLARKTLDACQWILKEIEDSNVAMQEKIGLIKRQEIQDIMKLFQEFKTYPEWSALASMVTPLGKMIDTLYDKLKWVQLERNREIAEETRKAIYQKEAVERKNTTQDLKTLMDNILVWDFADLETAYMFSGNESVLAV